MIIMSPEIYDWEAALHKLVTSSEGDLVGNVDAVDDTHVLVSTEGAERTIEFQSILLKDSMVMRSHLRSKNRNWKGSKIAKERDLVR